MVGDRIQANYDVLNQIARHFGTRQGQVDNLMQSVSRCVASLRAGGWVGKGAQAFYTEMDQIVFPAIRRLVAALHEGTQCTGHISRLMADAEREAAAIFANMGTDTILVMTPGTGGGDPAFKMFPAQGPTPTPQPQQGGPFKLTGVWQEELTIRSSQYDQETGYDDIVKKYLTNPDMMKYFGQAIDQLADHVNKGGAPLTPQQFYDIALKIAGDPGTALILAHNVTKTMTRRSQVDWDVVSRNPLGYEFYGKQFRFDPAKFHPD